jgi:GNAT superfamily N-acetyltransferase
VLGDAGGTYGDAMATLTYLFVMARLLRREPILGIGARGALSAVALVSRPDGAAPPPGFDTLRQAVWQELGPEARDRCDAFGEATRPLTVAAPHIHLNMLGVRTDAQGKGLGRRLLDRVHTLARDDAHAQGVTLTTEDPKNVALYRHCGYEVVGQARVAPELETWAMFRPDAAA